MPEPTIGALILTRDNRGTIQAALNSVAGLCRQIVVVDTGSTDDTPSIAARSGAEVYFFRWIDDFSAARNFALRHLKTDWVLMMDSDELLNEFDFGLFRKIAENNRNGGINVILQNSLNDSSSQTMNSHRYTRLFRNLPPIRFRGRIHEQIRPSIEEAGLDIIESDFSIIHLGYGSYSEEKNTRNLNLIEQEISENPNDDWLKYHLANTHFAAGRDEEATSLYTAIYNSPQLSRQQNETVALRLSQISLKYDNFQAVLKMTEFVSSNPQNEALRNYVAGTALLYLEKPHEALEKFKICLEINSPSLNVEDIKKAINVTELLIKSNN